MHDDGEQMTKLRERVLAAQASRTPENEPKQAIPSAVFEPPQHAQVKHNAARREVAMCTFYYGSESAIALPYAYLGAIDTPEPGKLVLEFTNRTVTIEGMRLDSLMAGLMNAQVSVVRASEGAVYDVAGVELVVKRVTVTKPQ